MLFRSLRLKLLALYATVLIAIAAFTGLYLFRSIGTSIERGVDIELTQIATLLASAIEPQEEDHFLIAVTGPLNDIFSATGPVTAYYSIWDRNGNLVDTSHPALEIDRPVRMGTRDRGEYREVSIRGPRNSLILVGRDASSQHRQLRELAARLTVAAVAVITLALATGWFLTQRALKPIRRIAAATASVSTSNLSERIDVDAMELELSDLARTINGAFDRLQKSFDQQSRFRAHASHELRTPLSIVLANAELALLRERTTDEYRSALLAIQSAGERMKKIIEGLLSLSQAEAGLLKVSREPVDLREIVHAICDLLQPLGEPRGITIRTDEAGDPEKPLIVPGDPDRLYDAVTNLVSNAVHYSHDGSPVHVRLDETPHVARLTVVNHGPPIPEADRPYLFTPFYRVEGSQQTHDLGCGLGLAITQWIAESHGGSVEFDSTDDGVTTFRLEVPRQAPPTPAT